MIADILQRLSRREELRDCGARLKHKDGSFRDVCISSNVYWSGDQFRYTRCFTRDITERKRAAETLEMIVAQRTAQLRETVGELEAFSYSISHDLRAPLRAMQGFSNLLAQDHAQELSPQAAEYVRRIDQSAVRMDKLIRDVLDYSRITRAQLDIYPVQVEPLLRGVIESYPMLQAQNAHICINGPFPDVLGNEAGLTQCFSNLLGNAVKFVAPDVSSRVRVWAETHGNRVRLLFEDNGIGIEKEAQERIFGIFERLNTEYPGTGIGLAIVKKALEKMGGSVGIDSEPGKGSRFWIELQRARSQERQRK